MSVKPTQCFRWHRSPATQVYSRDNGNARAHGEALQPSDSKNSPFSQARVRVSGNVNLAALQIVNAANIQVQGEACAACDS